MFEERMKAKIAFEYQVDPFEFNSRKVRQWIEKTIQQYDKKADTITVIFCNDAFLLDLNKKYLQHDYYTDIITFPYKEGDELESDLYISLDRVKENAHDFMATFDNELKRVMVHGLLHLMGYGDKSPDEIRLMREKEDYYIDTFGN